MVDRSGRASGRRASRVTGRRQAFTLIELLVVVAIIALLISILLPSLAGARKQARAVKCAANEHHVGQAFHIYLGENGSVFPPSYLYANGPSGEYDLRNQPANKPYGYLHWSWFLYERGKVNAEAFTCPEFVRGGTPRTNPGPEARDREPGQVDCNGDPSPNSLTDRQAERLAFTANAAIVPRNKFTTQLSGGSRVNQTVNESRIREPRGVILATELNSNWKLSGVPSGSGVESKSHRPISPFYHLSSGANEYAAAQETPGFIYGTPTDRTNYGLRLLDQIKDTVGVIDGAAGPEYNVVGRHHPGGDKFGGTANFLFTDGHVERKTILSTLKMRQWGERYYSLSGRSDVLPE